MLTNFPLYYTTFLKEIGVVCSRVQITEPKQPTILPNQNMFQTISKKKMIIIYVQWIHLR